MKTSHLLAITFLLGTSYMYAMEIEEPNENVARSLTVEDLPPEDQVAITDYLENELRTPKKIAEWDTETGSQVWALSYDPEDHTVVIGLSNGKVQIRSTEDDTVIVDDYVGLQNVKALTFNPGPETMATYFKAAYSLGMGRNILLPTQFSNEMMQIRFTEDSIVIEKWSAEALYSHPTKHSLVIGCDKEKVVIRSFLPVFAAHACQKRKLTVRQWLMLKELHDNTTNKPLYLNAGGRDTFDSLRDTEDGAERKPGIDDFYTLQKLKANDSETDETKKRWRIVPKQEDDSQNNYCPII